MQIDPAKKEEILKKVKDPNNVKFAVDKVFADLDKNNNGFIEKDEFAKACKEIMKKHNIPEPSEEQVKEGMKLLDQNSDGKISKDEMTKIITAIFKKIEEHLSK